MRVSVCIPTYNQEKYVGLAVLSVLQQTLSPFEIIIANDRSTDNTQTVLEEIARQNANIRIINRSQNLGITQNTDDCLRQATGDYIVRLDSDDLLGPTYIEDLCALLEAQPRAGYAHAAVQEIDQNGNPLRLRKLYRKEGYQSADEALQAALQGYRVAANILIFRKEALQKVGYLQSKINFAEDYYLAASLAAAGYGNMYSSKTLGYYRVWTDAGQVRKKRKLVEIRGLRSVFDEVLEPAFQQRNWNTEALLKNKETFACNHADCLGWPEYDKKEKEELEAELLLFSASKKVLFYSQLYKRGWAKFLQPIAVAKNKLRSVVKLFLK